MSRTTRNPQQRLRAAIGASNFSLVIKLIGSGDMEVILGPFLQVVLIAIELYMWVLIIGVVLSWLVAFNVLNTSNKFVYMIGDFCHRATEPILGPIRRSLPNLGGLDISPLVVILGLIFIKGVVIELHRNVG